MKPQDKEGVDSPNQFDSSNSKKIVFDSLYIENDIHAAELFLSRILGEEVSVEKIEYGNRIKTEKDIGYYRNEIIPAWRKIRFIITFFNQDTRWCIAHITEDGIQIEYGDFE